MAAKRWAEEKMNLFNLCFIIIMTSTTIITFIYGKGHGSQRTTYRSHLFLSWDSKPSCQALWQELYPLRQFTHPTDGIKTMVGIQKIVANTWNVFQPLLFGLVGTEVSVESLESKTIGMCLATLGLALSVRILSTFVLMSFANFRFKEKVFIALSWIPKATVQPRAGENVQGERVLLRKSRS